MVRILDAFEMLLRTKSYETLSINDVAREARTGASSIYARFRDKRSILLAVTDRVRDQAQSYFEDLYSSAERHPHREAFLERIIRGNLSWHLDHANIIKSSLLMDDADILGAISRAHYAMSAKLSTSLQHHIPDLAEERAFDAACKMLRLMMAVFQQMVIFGDIAPTGRRLTDDELVDALVASALAQLPARPADGTNAPE